MDGGVDSGFKKVEGKKFQPRLLHLKGARNVRVTVVQPKTYNLNAGDVFVLDVGDKLYQWNGPQSSRNEKNKGYDVCRRIKDEERQGKCQYFIIGN